MQIGEKIRKIRELKGLKQENIATALGMSVTAYGNLERGDTNLTYEKLEEIAKAMDITVSDIINMPDEFTIHNITGSHVAVAQLACNYGNINNPEVEGYKIAIEKLDAQVEYLKQQNSELLAAITGKKLG
jgi:transcriptional regulator with XRE-family HTH domain